MSTEADIVDLLARLDDQGLYSKAERIQMFKDAAAAIRQLRAERDAARQAVQIFLPPGNEAMEDIIREGQPDDALMTIAFDTANSRGLARSLRRRVTMADSPFPTIERAIVDYFEATGCDVIEKNGLEWFLSLYDEGPAISLTALAAAVATAITSHKGDTP